MISTEEQNKYSCETHINMAIDDFLVENETFPCLEKVSNRICNYCAGKAIYIIKLPNHKNT